MNPTNAGKITNVMIGGAAATVMLGLAGAFWPEVVSAFPTGFEAALGALIGGIAASIGGSFGADPE